MKTLKSIFIIGVLIWILSYSGGCTSAISCAAYKPHYNVKYLKKHNYVMCPIGNVDYRHR